MVQGSRKQHVLLEISPVVLKAVFKPSRRCHTI